MSLLTGTISIITALFMIVTLPIYFLFLLTLHKNRHHELLQSPFFRFMFSVGVANMGKIFTILLGSTLASSGFVPDFFIWMDGLSSRLYNCAVFGYGFAQIFGVTIISVNRFTAYIYPLRHIKIWTDSLTRKIIIFQWISAILLIIPIAFVYEYNIYIENDNRTIRFQWTNAAELGLYSMLTAGVLDGLMMIIIIVMYAVIFTVALIRKIKSRKVLSKKERMALRMAAVGFICSFGLIIYLSDLLAQIIAWNLFRYNFLDLDTNWMIIDVGNCLFAVIDPYAMFLFSSIVRKRFVAIVCSYRKIFWTDRTITATTPGNSSRR